jgi:homoserine kinase
MKKKICAFAPATIANLNVGFDVMGMSLGSLGDKVEVSPNGSSENRITEIVNGDGLPYDVEKNSCSGVIKMMQKKTGRLEGLDIRIKKGFASGSGLGSSSASSAAAAVAFNAYAGNPFLPEELIPFAAEGERIACGTAHADNVAPSILGGLVLLHESKIVSLPLPEDIHAVLFFPKITINTKGSRSIVKTEIPIETVNRQVADMGAFVASLYQNDLDLLKASLQDLLVEPSRKILIPKFDEMRHAAMENNSLGFGISGSGPSMFALAQNQDQAEKILTALKKVYEFTGIDSQCFIEKLSNKSNATITSFED